MYRLLLRRQPVPVTAPCTDEVLSPSLLRATSEKISTCIVFQYRPWFLLIRTWPKGMVPRLLSTTTRQSRRRRPADFFVLVDLANGLDHGGAISMARGVQVVLFSRTVQVGMEAPAMSRKPTTSTRLYRDHLPARIAPATKSRCRHATPKGNHGAFCGHAPTEYLKSSRRRRRCGIFTNEYQRPNKSKRHGSCTRKHGKTDFRAVRPRNQRNERPILVSAELQNHRP